MMRRRLYRRRYRLSFGGTRAKRWAPTLKMAIDDARYWVHYGQKRVCIDRSLPSGRFQRVRCITR
jgi:hypothetical protein